LLAVHDPTPSHIEEVEEEDIDSEEDDIISEDNNCEEVSSIELNDEEDKITELEKSTGDPPIRCSHKP
jgi:hypothetical protein